MIHRETYILLSAALVLLSLISQGQDKIRISGRVMDPSTTYTIPGVKVLSTSGTETETDSLGVYRILTTMSDSIYFFYNDKNSIKYPIKDIYDPNEFDIAMHAEAKSKYKVLEQVTVFSDTYRQDSLENRMRYAKIFGNARPSITTGMGPNEVPGIDIGSIIEVFQFRKNKQRQAFQQRLLQQERDDYVDYRFNAKLVGRITGLSGKNLSDYMVIYRPPYDFVSLSSQVEFYQYIIDSANEFRRRFLIR